MITMNKTKKVSLISVGVALALTPLVIYAVRKIRSNINGGCCTDEETEGRKHIFGGWKNKRGNRSTENLEA